MEKADDEVKYWFPARRVGWGWGLPCALPGWLTVALYAATVFAAATWFPPLVFLATVAVATSLLIAVCKAKGEPTRADRTG